MEDRLYNEFAQSLKEFLQGVAREELAEAGPPPLPPKKQPLPAGHEADLQTPLAGNWETNNLEQDSATVLRAFSDKLKKKGIDASKLKKLGVGTMGVAYDLGDKVLKVTKDVREAKASAIVAGKNIPNIVQVYDIWKFPGVNWYGLIIEKLTPLSKEEEQQLTQSVVNTKFPLLLHQAGDDWNKAMQMLAQQTIRNLATAAYTQFPDANPAQGGQGMNDPRVAQYVRDGSTKSIQDFDRLTKGYNMRQLFKSLKSLGIQYYDFHGGNYGRRADGTLVLFDLGRSISKGADPAELQEKFKLIEQRFGLARAFRHLS